VDARANAWIAAVTTLGGRVGAAFLDASTGEFLAWEASGADAWTQFRERLEAFAPRELVHPEDIGWPDEARPDPTSCVATTSDPYPFAPASQATFSSDNSRSPPSTATG
jgi:DNA mismatch repair ATPase MutS